MLQYLPSYLVKQTSNVCCTISLTGFYIYLAVQLLYTLTYTSNLAQLAALTI